MCIQFPSDTEEDEDDYIAFESTGFPVTTEKLEETFDDADIVKEEVFATANKIIYVPCICILYLVPYLSSYHEKAIKAL